MAKIEKKKTTKSLKKSLVSPFNIYWDSRNYILLIAGVVIGAIGFVFMTVNPWDSTESLFISPILLFVAYFLIFPLSILLKKKEENNNKES
ncbi:MAG: hypothetical protein GX452_03145 [Ignavibacteriales bacterium]|jgi:hypothetical protein|nr:hypothetical protein [Ignavibacteriaceae bacterium]NLH60380.1 hypothetical protein [Ignavibacteriales bacterium]HOJ18875.1 hypothetical protein [Ignavibacteriaceae bacterium]HPO56645.1 hypothetical protein [Ignavibacteriaceae bacterium]